MKTFLTYLDENDNLNPLFPYGGSSLGPGMGQYVPVADLNAQSMLLGPSQPKDFFRAFLKNQHLLIMISILLLELGIQPIQKYLISRRHQRKKP